MDRISGHDMPQASWPSLIHTSIIKLGFQMRKLSFPKIKILTQSHTALQRRTLVKPWAGLPANALSPLPSLPPELSQSTGFPNTWEPLTHSQDSEKF